MSSNLENDLCIAAFNQNAETFRSLNALMWQIPLIAMTLTGGLWFGVASADADAPFKISLLVLAASGNIGLIIILHRVRYVLGCYLKWLKTAYPSGYVAAVGLTWCTRSNVIRTVFQIMLGFATFI